MPDVEIKLDEAKFNRLKWLLAEVSRGLPRVVSRSLNRTATSARAQTTRELGAEVNVRQKTIRERIKLSRATYRHWQATLSIGLRRISLISFIGTHQTKKGVTYRIGKNMYRKLVPSAFIQTIRRTGYPGVLKRMTKRRKPLAWLRGPSLGQVFEKGSTILADVQQSSGALLEKNIDDQVEFVLRRK